MNKNSAVRLSRDSISTLILMAAAGIGITAAGIVFHQSPLRILPLYISLVISFLQSRVNRYAPLLGSFNSLLYAAVYAYYGLLASMAYAVLISCPLQLVTFLRWNKKPYGSSTVFRALTGKQRLLTAAVSVIAGSATLFLLLKLGSSHSVLDTVCTLLGILATILMMLSYVEFSYLTLLGQVFGIALYISMLAQNPEQATYLIYSAYCLVCQINAFINIRRLYAEHQT